MTKLLTPFYIAGKVVKGFGRGSKQLGIPTANIDTDLVQNISLDNGIYYGFCQLFLTDQQKPQQNGPTVYTNGTDTDMSLSQNNDTEPIPPIYPMVCSLGWNPQFNNSIRSLEVHILNKFESDFYGSTLRVAICGFIRDEQKFESLDQLIQTIHNDIDVTKNELKDRQRWSQVIGNEFFKK